MYLAVEDIDHSKTKARSPQSNGFVERFHRTMKQEFYDMAFRKKIYRTLEALQADVDQWLIQYNQFRPHSGRYCYGKTPWQTWMENKPKALEKELENCFERGDNHGETDEQHGQNKREQEVPRASYLTDNCSVR